jgi:hypothetical protein
MHVRRRRPGVELLFAAAATLAVTLMILLNG